MSRPDFTDPAQLTSYKRELRGLYKGWRWLGLAIVAVGVALMFLRDGQFDALSIGLIVVGWAILIGVIVQRTRYHKRRMAEPAA